MLGILGERDFEQAIVGACRKRVGDRALERPVRMRENAREHDGEGGPRHETLAGTRIAGRLNQKFAMRYHIGAPRRGRKALGTAACFGGSAGNRIYSLTWPG